MWLGTAQIAAAIANVMAEARASGLLRSTCTIQQPDGTLNQGAPSYEYVDVTGLTDIACMIAPVQMPPGNEVKNSMSGGTSSSGGAGTAILSVSPYHVLLDDYYGDVAITGTDGNTYYGPQAQMRAVIDDVNYDILSVDYDSQRTQTRLHVRLASV